MVTKTIGRLRTAPDLSRVESIEAAVEDVTTGLAENPRAASFVGTSQPQTPRERALWMENFTLKRRLHTAESRVAVMTMGGKGSTPITGTFERMQAFEGVVLATDKMTDAAKLEALAQMVADVKSFAERRDKYLGEVETNVALTTQQLHDGAERE